MNRVFPATLFISRSNSFEPFRYQGRTTRGSQLEKKESIKMRPAKDTFKNLHAVIRSRHIFAAGFVLASLFAIMCYALPSKAMVSSPLAPKTALIYGPSVSGGASSQEALAAITQGYTVTVVTHATWTTMTQAQFGTYDLLVIGDPTCSSSSTTAAVTNVAVWGPVVMGTAGGRTLAGNRILVGTDPVFHSGGYTTVRATIIRTGIDFAGKQPGRTGLYISTSCSHGTIGSVLAGLSLLSTGTGTWTSNPAPPCGGNVSLIAAEPSFATLTTASLQGWGCSVHNSFPTFPSDWSALAVATDTP